MSGSTKTIKASTLLWPALDDSGIAMKGSLTASTIMGFALCVIPPFFAVAVVRDKEVSDSTNITQNIVDLIQFSGSYLLVLAKLTF